MAVEAATVVRADGKRKKDRGGAPLSAPCSNDYAIKAMIISQIILSLLEVPPATSKIEWTRVCLKNLSHVERVRQGTRPISGLAWLGRMFDILI
eukprot:3382040-Amphidinium_carterae.1